MTQQACDSVTIEEDRGIGGINPYQGEWEVIKVTVDSGAIDTVTPPNTGKYFPIVETESSKRGLHYRAANGTKIRPTQMANIEQKSKPTECRRRGFL